ncbi:MAG TPA: epoxide hydrolase, partial [Chryseolinea sp.]
MQKFTIQVPEKDVEYLNQRLATARWFNPAAENSWEKGVPPDYLKELADYWQNKFDWKKQEAILNQYPQFIAEIDGQKIHYLHVKSPQPNAIPLMLIHGWPGSFADFIKVIEPLSNPQSADPIAFDLV